MWQAKPPESLDPEATLEPLPKPDTWYQFCVQQKYAYEAQGEHVAAMVWWVLRFIDDVQAGTQADPCTEEGYEDLKAYWAYKMDWLEGRSQ